MSLIELRTSHRVFSPGSLVRLFATRLAVWRSRRALARLDAQLLDDIGLSAEQARKEAELGVWDVPQSWRCR